MPGSDACAAREGLVEGRFLLAEHAEAVGVAGEGLGGVGLRHLVRCDWRNGATGSQAVLVRMYWCGEWREERGAFIGIWDNAFSPRRESLF